MNKCISSHGEYSDHEPGDPCPYCGEYDTARIIAERDKAQARIQAVRDVHRRYGVYELEDSCNIAGDQHREEHHHEDSDDAGEFYCDLLPIGAQCDHCRDSYGDRVNWPCDTIRALDGDNGPHEQKT